MTTLSLKRNGYKRSPLGPYWVKKVSFDDDKMAPQSILRDLNGRLIAPAPK